MHMLNRLLRTSLGAAAILVLVSLPVLALSPDDLNKLKLVEQNLFFKTYEDETPENRLSRVEKRVFGDAAEGSPEERLANVLNVAKTLEKAPPPPRATTVKPEVSKQQQKQFEEDEKLRQEDAADQARRRILQARNDEVNGLLTEAVSLWKAKRADESVEKFQQVIRLAPDYAEAHFSLGVVYEAQGRYIDALNCYKRAAELEPNKKDYRQAVATLDKKAQAMQEDNGKKAELRALADDAAGAYRRGEYISALDLYKQLDDKAPNQPLVKYNIATIYLAMKNPVQALTYFKQAHKLKPDEERFAQAAKQLEINLKRDEDERLSAERAWTQQNQNGNQSNQQRNQQRNQQQQSTGGGALGAGAGPPSSTFGILIKPNKEGVLVTTIGIGSRASRCGLQRGDVIRAVDGIVIQAPDQFQQIFAGKQPNQSVQLLIQRKDQIVQIIL
jgi:tetratricopeptide (TPR) repeat protein